MTDLKKDTFNIPFFGSPASGTWSFSTPLPDCRVVSADLFVTNAKGNSPVTAASLTAGIDFGLRTLSGGQLSFQVEAFLAIETRATPDLIVESAHSVRDVFAMIRQAPVGGPVELQITQNGALYCSLTFADGATISNSVAGAALPPLIPGARLSLDILMVGPSNPGADLTVIDREREVRERDDATELDSHVLDGQERQRAVPPTVPRQVGPEASRVRSRGSAAQVPCAARGGARAA